MKFDKPIYLGSAILELSKLLMYEFYFDVLQPYFGEKNLRLHYMDTDSFILEINTNSLTDDLKKLSYHFDFSNYPKDHELYDETNKKVPGKFKDELGGSEMTEFIVLKSKMYAYKTRESETKKCKGISGYVVQNKITFDDYINSLLNSRTYKHTMNSLRSDKHEMYLIEQNKSSLDPFDDKRYIRNDGIRTLPFGSIEINEDRYTLPGKVGSFITPQDF